jgi:PAS domain S-box-containing protein
VTDRVGTACHTLASIAAIASGVLAMPITASPGAYLIWVRPEEVRTVTWGGDPTKPVTTGDHPADLSPRRSFAQWHQVMRGQSEPWTEADIAAATLIGGMVSDVVLQSRSVRLLIAQDQLDRLRQDVAASNQPVIITDSAGEILLVNQACARLIGETNQPLSSLVDLPSLFVEPKLLSERLQALQKLHLSWRSENALRRANSGATPVQIRADPIFAAADRILGYVLMLTDLTDQKAANAARRHFQDGVIEQNREAGDLITTTSGLSYQNLLRTIVENAQLAGLEITDRIDPTRMPEKLMAVRDSVRRAAILLKNLLG